MVVLTSFPPPVEGIVHREDNTTANVQGRNMGNGTLYIAESRVSWMGENGEGFSLEYPSISLHAVSRDLTAFPQECVYLMIDGKLGGEEMNGSAESSDEEEDETSDVRFIPQNKEALDEIFQAMNSCQALHPDEDDTNSEDDLIGDDDYYTSEEAVGQLTEQGRATLQRLEEMMVDDSGPAVGRADNEHGDGTMDTGTGNKETGQFEDADQPH